MTNSEDITRLQQLGADIGKTIGPWTNCPHCGADKSHQYIANYDYMWHDGDVYCNACGGYVRMYDAG